jgi:hypothetical protein
MPDDGDNARLGTPKFSLFPAARPALLLMRPCRRHFDIGLQAIGSLVGTLPGASFCGRQFGTLPAGLFCAGPVGNPEGPFLLS